MKKYISIIIAIFLVISSFFCANNNTKTIFADSEVIYNNIDGIADENLYHALIWNNHNKYISNPSERATYLTQDIFSDTEELDLSYCDIETLLGLDLLDLSNLKRLYLGNNKLTLLSLNEDVLNVIKNVEILDLSYNNFSYFDLSYFTNATSIDLSYNSISEVVMLDLKQNTSVNLMANNISSVEDIEIDNTKHYNINLSYNKISQVTAELENCDVDYYFQNTLNEELNTSNTIKVLSGYSMPNFNIKVFDASTSEVVETIYKDEEKQLDVGNYVLKFYNDNNLLYNTDDVKTFAYNNINIQVKPQRPIIKFYVNDEEVDGGPFESDVTLRFFSNDNTTILYSINGKDFIEGNSITLKEERTNFIIVKCVKNNIESGNYNVYVTIKKPLPIPTSLLFILCAVAFLGIVFLIKLFVNAPVNFNKEKESKDENN